MSVIFATMFTHTYTLIKFQNLAVRNIKNSDVCVTRKMLFEICTYDASLQQLYWEINKSDDVFARTKRRKQHNSSAILYRTNHASKKLLYIKVKNEIVRKHCFGRLYTYWIFIMYHELVVFFSISTLSTNELQFFVLVFSASICVVGKIHLHSFDLKSGTYAVCLTNILLYKYIDT